MCTVLSMCELGWLYNKVDSYITKVEGPNHSKGLIAQAFGFSLQEELSDYFRLLTVLEGELLRTAHYIVNNEEKETKKKLKVHDAGNNNIGNDEKEEDEEEKFDPSSGLTLLRLRAWMLEPIERMCLLARLVNAVSDLHGGALASLIHSHGLHGDGSITTIVSRFKHSTCIHIYTYKQLYKYINVYV